MKCDFLGYGGGWFGSYRCEKDDNKILDKSTIDRFCDNSLNYRNCPIYKKTPSSGCYLTTVTCEILDLPDDNHCLETMRWYRDNVMMDLENGPEILKQYNNVGPVIADSLREDRKTLIIAGVCKEVYIESSVALIEAGKKMKEEGNETAAKKMFYKAMMPYVDMTRGLMEYYHIDPNNTQKEEPTLDKGIARVKKPIETEKVN